MKEGKQEIPRWRQESVNSLTTSPLPSLQLEEATVWLVNSLGYKLGMEGAKIAIQETIVVLGDEDVLLGTNLHGGFDPLGDRSARRATYLGGVQLDGLEDVGILVTFTPLSA